MSSFLGETNFFCCGHRITSQIDKIYEKLERIWSNDSTGDEINRALEAMKLITPLARTDVATKSYRLFHTLTTPAPPTHSEKLEASRLALNSACEGAEPQLLVNDSQGTLSFLNHDLELTL